MAKQELNTELNNETPVNPIEAAQAEAAQVEAQLAELQKQLEAAKYKRGELAETILKAKAEAEARELAELETALAEAEAANAPAVVLGAMRAAIAAAKAPKPVQAAPGMVRPASATIPAYGPNAVFRVGANAQRIQNRHTAQLGHNQGSGLGSSWVMASELKPNSRWLAIQALAALGETFTHTQARVALANLGQGVLSSGSPASYIRAFVKQGYLEVVQA